jgi:hypothetical protein
MSTILTAVPPRGFALLLGWRRLRFTLCAFFVIGLPIGLGFHSAVLLGAISQVIRGDNETAPIHLKHRQDLLSVSRSYLHLFPQL